MDTSQNKYFSLNLYQALFAFEPYFSTPVNRKQTTGSDLSVDAG